MLFKPKYASLLSPNYAAPAHQELKGLAQYKREFGRESQIEAHTSIEARKKLAGVIHADGEQPRQYQPINWPPV